MIDNDSGAELVAQLSVDLAEIVGDRALTVGHGDGPGGPYRFVDVELAGRPVQLVEYLDAEVATYTHVRAAAGTDPVGVVDALVSGYDVPRDAVVWTA